MIIISHRGNIDEVDPSRENSPDYIDEAIQAGYDVEIDLRVSGGLYYLGHDEPQYLITTQWLQSRKDHLWIHAKNYGAAISLANELNFCRWFAHEHDRYCLTSCGYIWLHDTEVEETRDCIVPLLSKLDIYNRSYIISERRAHAVCTDYPKIARHIMIHGKIE